MTSSGHDCSAVIRSCKFFSRLDADSTRTLADIAVVRQFERNRCIATPGQEPAGMYVVVSGQVRVFTVSASGKEHVLHLVGPTQTFLEVAALGEFAVPATCEALEDTVALLLPAEALRALLAEHPRLCRQVLASMAIWVRHLLGLVEDLTLRDATGRFARYLLDVSERQEQQGRQGRQGPADLLVELPSLKKHLASHLNLTSETFSRTLRRLTDAGLVTPETHPSGSAAIRILDREGLQAASAGERPGL